MSPASADAPFPTASDEQSVRVVTVAFNPGEELDRFLASLAAATVRRLTVVIADNGTEHDVVTAAAQRYGARVVGDGTNLGYGAGANLAAAGSSRQAPESQPTVRDPPEPPSSAVWYAAEKGLAGQILPRTAWPAPLTREGRARPEG